MKTIKRIPIIVAGTLLLFGMTACEVTDPLEDVELILDVEDAIVDLGGGEGITVPVIPDRPSGKTDRVNNNLEVTSVNDLKSIKLKPEFFSFSAAAGKSGGIAATGVVEVTVAVGGAALPESPITVTIQNDVPTNVSPETIDFQKQTYTVNEDAIDALLEQLPEEERPTLADFKSLTMAEAVELINRELESNEIDIFIGVNVTESDPSDPLSGELTLKEMIVSAQVSQGAN